MRKDAVAGLAGLVALLGAAQLSAETVPDTPAGWLKKPTYANLVSVWPRKAMQTGHGGRAVLKCIVTTVGSLRDCEVLSEEPPGEGFGAAALALTAQFMMKPATKGGRAVEDEVRIPVDFPGFGAGVRSRMSVVEDAPGVRAVSRMPWTAAPTVADVVTAYPAKARAAKVAGRVVLACSLNRAGALGDCLSTQEAPRGYGFAAAARSLAGKFRGPVRDEAGASLVGASIQLPFVFAPETLDPAEPAIGKPSWRALPDAAEFGRLYPEAANKAGVLKARILLNCRVTPSGALDGCAVQEEDPPGLGFGDAALRLSTGFRLGVWSEEGLPTVGGHVNVPISYELDAPPGQEPARP